MQKAYPKERLLIAWYKNYRLTYIITTADMRNLARVSRDHLLNLKVF